VPNFKLRTYFLFCQGLHLFSSPISAFGNGAGAPLGAVGVGLLFFSRPPVFVVQLVIAFGVPVLWELAVRGFFWDNAGPFMNEADTCRTYILPKLKDAHWADEAILEQYVLTPGRIVPLGGQHTRKQGLRPDYVLSIRRNIPIAVVEAKAEYKHPAQGLQQAMRYAEMMGLKFAYASNGKGLLSMISSPGGNATLMPFLPRTNCGIAGAAF